MQQHVSANRPQQFEAAFSNSPSDGFASFIAGGMFSVVAFKSPKPRLKPPRKNFAFSSSNLWRLSVLYACFEGT